MADYLLIFVSAAVGASAQEVLYWYDIYKKLEHKKYEKLMQSRRYWMIVGFFILATGVMAMLWFDATQKAPPKRDVLLFGITLPLLIKQLIRSRPGGIKLGSNDDGYFDIR